MEKLDNISRSSYIMLYITLITTSLDPVIYNIYIYIYIYNISFFESLRDWEDKNLSC